MVSYADFHGNRTAREEAMRAGLHRYLDVPDDIRIYLDNGAFNFAKHEREVPRLEYEAFVAAASPDWYPIPQDFIPSPSMNYQKQTWCRMATMEVNRKYSHDGYVPVIHVGRYIQTYLKDFAEDDRLSEKDKVAIGGIVPNLLRAHKALKYRRVLSDLKEVRERLSDKTIHLYGVGGNSTLHIARLLGIDSVDSTGWRNRAARGIVQLPGSGDRSARNLGSWNGRGLSNAEWETLEDCECPACQKYGLEGLKAKRTHGFCNRATHNLWVLLNEARLIEQHIADSTYEDWYETHVENSTYKPLIDFLLQGRERGEAGLSG